MTRLFHLIAADDWQAWRGRPEYAPDSLASEGFVHLSTAAQVPGTASLFFAGVDDLVALEIEVPEGDPRLRWEAAEGPRGVEEFPHFHGPIPLAWVAAASTVRSGVGPLGHES